MSQEWTREACMRPSEAPVIELGAEILPLPYYNDCRYCGKVRAAPALILLVNKSSPEIICHLRDGAIKLGILFGWRKLVRRVRSTQVRPRVSMISEV